MHSIPKRLNTLQFAIVMVSAFMATAWAQAPTFTQLHSFDGTDGQSSYAGLIQTANGDFFGTTQLGGAHGLGTVFQITPTGTLATLYSFCSQGDCTDGYYPETPLTRATGGDFYGTTSRGGTIDSTDCTRGCGTVFKITPTAKLTTLYSFSCSSNLGCSDGGYPRAALIQATDGDFYGTTAGGDVGNAGTIFKITANSTLSTLYSFNFAAKGAETPVAPLIQGTDADFYGTTVVGGTHNLGTVFSLSVGLGPFVETQVRSGKVGAAVKILGSNLSGATTGYVEVTTPSVTLQSNSSFSVEP
jgi:uncharacterized repeat protein (TIGR03803 family)